MAGSGGAERLTGQAWDEPARRARHDCLHGVIARQGAYRAPDPEPCALIGRPLSLLSTAAIVTHGCRVLLLTRAWRELDHAPPRARSWHRTVRGNRYVSRSQKPGFEGSAVAAEAAIEPPYVCGAATSGLRHHTELKSAPETDG